MVRAHLLQGEGLQLKKHRGSFLHHLPARKSYCLSSLPPCTVCTKGHTSHYSDLLLTIAESCACRPSAPHDSPLAYFTPRMASSYSSSSSRRCVTFRERYGKAYSEFMVGQFVTV
ncbi:uncharacterized protein LOC129746093 [Uranotaenia lowii]|uniref:uncharacterized protein LOC129746093 n=1 Tax=Uranotaenia lowii TaxID=190385 RepID=UPI002478800A|nr:uncharacterized protein LOC129746093 [Uranotaenia lowii]